MAFKLNPITGQLDLLEYNKQTAKAIVAPFGSSFHADYRCQTSNANDTEIQDAIDAVADAGGGIVHLREGTYNIASGLTMRNNVWLRGSGWGATILAAEAGLTTRGILNDPPGSTSATPLTDFTVSDLKLDGTNVPRAPSSTAKKGILAAYTLRLKVMNVYCYNTAATGFGPDYNVDCLFSNCIADNCGDSGADPGHNGFGIGTGGYEEESVLFVNCIAINGGNNGFLLERQFSASFSTDPRSYQFTNCYAYNNARRGFRNSSCVGVTYTNCKSIGNGLEGYHTTHISVLAPPTESVFIGCEARDNGDDGFHNADDTRYSNAIFDSCFAWNNAGYGIRAAGDRTKISNCHIWENDNSGIRVHGTGTWGGVGVPIGPVRHLQLTNNTCWNNGQAGSGERDGISISGATWDILAADIWGNHCYDDQGTATQDYGINIFGVVNNALIFGNEAFGHRKGGIYYRNQIADTAYNVQILNNTAYNNGRAGGVAPELRGIHIQGQTSTSSPIDGVIVMGNRCFDDQGSPTQTYGVSVSEEITNAQVINNDVRGNLTGAISNGLTSQVSNVLRRNIGYNSEAFYDQGNVSGATTYNLANGSIIKSTLTANVTATVSDGVNPGDRLTLEFMQDGTGGWTISSWSANVVLVKPFTPSPTASARTFIEFIWDGTKWADTDRTPTALGDVVGPATATDNAVVRYDGTTGKLVQNSSVIVSDNGGIVVNEDGNDVDSRFEGDTDQNLIYLDAGNDRIGIGTASPSSKLQINGTVTSGNTSTLGASGTLQITADADGGDFNIFHGNGTKTLAFYGAAGNTLHVNMLDGNLTIGAGSLIKATSSPPASASAAGTTGQIEWDSGFVYVCVATNTWVRAALSTW